MYYHFDYHGEPVSYEWVNGNPLAKIWEQMTAAVKAFPATADWSGAEQPPRLRYAFFAENEGLYTLKLHLAPRNPSKRGSRMLCGISINQGERQTIPTISKTYHAGDGNWEWSCAPIPELTDRKRSRKLERKGARQNGTEREKRKGATAIR